MNADKSLHPDTNTIEKKLQMMANLYQFAFKIKSFQLHGRYPNLSEKEIEQKVYALIESGCK